MANSLHVLMYYHLFYVKYLNIVSKFVMSCDYLGNFVDKPVNPKFLFTTYHDHHTMLRKCNKNRNNVDWFESCVKICSKFDLMSYKDFFAPKLLKYIKYSKFLTEKMNIIEDKEKKDNLLK